APFDDFATMLNSSMVTASMVTQAVITLVIYVLVALGIRHGWRSMRIIGTIFAVFSLLSFSFVSPLAAVFSVGSVILGIVGIVYAWLPASTEYFRRKAWQKAAKQAYPDMPLRCKAKVCSSADRSTVWTTTWSGTCNLRGAKFNMPVIPASTS